MWHEVPGTAVASKPIPWRAGARREVKPRLRSRSVRALRTTGGGGKPQQCSENKRALHTTRRRGKPQLCSANKRALHTTAPEGQATAMFSEQAGSPHNRGGITASWLADRAMREKGGRFAPPPAASGVWRLAGELGDFRVRPAGGEHLEGGGFTRRRRGGSKSGVVGKGKRAGSAAAESRGGGSGCSRQGLGARHVGQRAAAGRRPA